MIQECARVSKTLRTSLVGWLASPILPERSARSTERFGEVVRVTRGSLSWLISVPHDGSMPYDGAFPTLIELPAGPHPSSRMANLGCQLERLAIAHPEGARLAKAVNSVFADDRIVISTGVTAQIRATINTPDGRRELA